MKIINHRRIGTHHLKDIVYVKNYRRLLIKTGLYLVFLSVVVLIALLPNILSNEKRLSRQHYRFKTDLKYILIWKQPKKSKRNLVSKEIKYMPGQKQFIKQNCPYINCYITYNRSLLLDEEDFDAVVFTVHDTKKLVPYNVNLGRSSHQTFILKSFESAEHHPICNPMFDGFFNWTWTYKLDSDIPQPFINIYDIKNNLIGPNNVMKWEKDMVHTDKYKNKISGKTKAVAWLVTNCKLKDKHLGFVNDLRNELQGYNYSVDIVGPCSQIKCSKGGIVKCYQLIEKEYYFHLVLEEATIEDYVTEKMARAMNYFSVPIVNSGVNYTKFLPPGSYINAETFNIKKLGAVLDYLIKNPKKYSYFFDWRNYYYYATRPRNYICDLCTKLNENNNGKKNYKEIRRWWNPDFEATCQRNYLYNMFRDTP